jgi:hypothetical protein
MNTPKNSRKIQKLALLTLAGLVTAVALFYLEEDWRGKHAWNACKSELEAKGIVLDWNKYIPPPAPDDQNFFTASTNILIRFHKAQTPAETDAAKQSQWLNIVRDSLPTLNTANTKPLVVAELTFVPANTASGVSASGHQIIDFDDPATRYQVLETIEKNVGHSLRGATGIRLSELSLSNLVPARITLRAATRPAIADLDNFLSSEQITNLGRVHIQVADSGTFQVLLTNVQVVAAADYLTWSDQFMPALAEVREALKRPYAILPGDYTEPYAIPIPNFVTIRAVVQLLAERAQCHLLAHDPEAALREISLIHDLCKILQKPPTGKPETLVEAMINVAVNGLYASAIADGMHLREWNKPQLEALEDQLKTVDLPYWVAEAFRGELAADVRTFEKTPAYKMTGVYQGAGDHPHSLWTNLKDPLYRFFKFAPRGWIYQNLVNLAKFQPEPLESFDLEQGTILPRAFDKANRNLDKFFTRKSAFSFLASMSLPNYAKAVQTTAYNQNLVNEAQIACALERYRLVDGEYPATLDALVPSFLVKLPHDIIGGQPLHYRRTDDGKFVLYSIGWNERDDGGHAVFNHDGTEDRLRGDWVWPN